MLLRNALVMIIFKETCKNSAQKQNFARTYDLQPGSKSISHYAIEYYDVYNDKQYVLQVV